VTRVDGTTQVYAVLGDPVDHSQSPRIQNAAFQAAGMNAVYVALEVKAARLKEALGGLHAARVLGLNLTAPHKEAAYPLVRERTPDAEEAGAVNTLRWEPEGWSGHATDGTGFLAWVEEAKIDLSGRGVLVLGAGGAARAIVPKLLELGPETIRVASRTAEHALSLVRRAEKSPGKTRLHAAALGGDTGGFAWNLLVRAISTGPVSTEEERWWDGHTPHAAVLDLNYGVRAAAARAHAEAQGLRYEDGSALLVHQGAASFEFWTGKKAPIAAMREAMSALG
jgi:shikimate dehydrogenase